MEGKQGVLLLGRYRLDDMIGSGGMAEVYRAVDEHTGAVVAVKILKQEFNDDKEFVKRFQREAMAAQTMLHPNIIKVVDVGEEQNMKFIVMEYVDGVTIKDLVRSEGALGVERTVDYAIQIARAIEHAHRCHIVHRDIKSQNIMVDRHGVIKVADFGIARATNAATVTQTAEGVLGSVHYFSPEQARGEVADEQSDIYSLGVVTYEMATGQLPFDADQLVTVALKHINQPPELPSSLNRQIVPALDEVILKAMSKDRSARYKSAIAMEVDLSMVIAHPAGGFVALNEEHALEAEKEPAGRAEAKRRRREKNAVTPDEKAARRLRRRQRLLLAALVVVLAAMGVLIYMAARVWNETDWSAGSEGIGDTAGMPASEAAQYLIDSGYTYATEHEFSGTVPRGTVISQELVSEKGGAAYVLLTISSGPQYPAAPSLANASLDEAESILYGLGLELGEVSYGSAGAGYNLGEIYQQFPTEGTLLSNGDSVMVYVNSDGTAQGAMPRLIGLTAEQAELLLGDVGVELGETTYVRADDIPAGTVVEQSVPEGEDISQGAVVDISVASPDAMYTGEVEFSINLAAEAAVTVYFNSGGVSETLVDERCPAGEKTYDIFLTSATGGPASVVICFDGIEVQTIAVEMKAAE